MGSTSAQIRKWNDVTVVAILGRLDVDCSLEVEGEVNRLIDDGCRKLLINLKDVDYLSSSGLRIFIAVMRRLDKVGGELKLCEMSEEVKKIFDVVELTEFFSIYPSEEKALGDF